jgi:hypothetical protein
VIVALLQVGAPGHRAQDHGGPPRGSLAVRRTLGLGAPLLVVVTAVTLVAQAGGGLYWWPAAVVAAFVGALANVWVLLIEVLR